jgi:hypothetical protein
MKDSKELATLSGAAAEVQQLFDKGVYGFSAETPSVTTNFITALRDGKTFFWPISEPVQGVETWYRKAKVDESTGDVATNEDGSVKMLSAVRRAPIGVYRKYEELSDWKADKSKAFIAVLVFNYSTKKLEMLSTSNSDLYNSLFELFKKDDQKDPVFQTGFSITRTPGEKKVIGSKPVQTYHYVVGQTKKQDQVPSDVVKALEGLEGLPNIQALLENIDPFTGISLSEE